MMKRSSSKFSEPLLIGLDLGTTVIKGVLMDSDGDIMAEAAVNTCFTHPRRGWVEVEPEQHYSNVCDVLRRLAAAAPTDVAALAMAAASGNTLLTDECGSPLTPIINWMDERGEQRRSPAIADLTPDAVAQITGWPCTSSFPLAHLAWLRDNAPATYHAAAHYGMDTDWLLYRLTGSWVMDHSTATTFHLQHQLSGAYHKPLLRRLDISEHKLSPLVRSGQVVGSITAAAARDTGLGVGTQVVTGSFDHPAAAFAVGVLSPGQLMLSCGTSWVGFMPHPDRNLILTAKLLCDPFLSFKGGPWAGMFSVPRIGRAIEWYIDNAIAPDEPDRMAVFSELSESAAPGAGGLRIDLRAPPQVPPASRANVSRAVMEGAAHLLKEKLDELRAFGFQHQRAVMVGGPSRSRIWREIVADITGLELTSAGSLAGARGAAMLAAEGIASCSCQLATENAGENHD